MNPSTSVAVVITRTTSLINPYSFQEVRQWRTKLPTGFELGDSQWIMDKEGPSNLQHIQVQNNRKHLIRSPLINCLSLSMRVYSMMILKELSIRCMVNLILVGTRQSSLEKKRLETIMYLMNILKRGNTHFLHWRQDHLHQEIQIKDILWQHPLQL